MVRYNCSARLKNLFFYGHGTGVYCAIDEVVLFLYFSPSVSAVTLVGLHVIKSDFLLGQHQFFWVEFVFMGIWQTK